ncbi:MAG: class IV adenylate cyclase [Chloroflexota bacterium]|nr:class IV adenylate cyclase [Chloroflexota bacterium]
MTMQTNREIKAFCPDFDPVRQLLAKHGASFVESRDQVDYYYNLADAPEGNPRRRLKIRIDKEAPQVIYYEEGQESGGRTSSFRIWGLNGHETKEMLDAVLGVRAVVNKQREIWTKDNVVFNLDEVESLGQILEVEIRLDDGFEVEAQLREYQELFGPYLGDEIDGSNEDLVDLLI